MMNLLKSFISGILLLMPFHPGWGQEFSDPDVFNRFTSQKVAFFTERLQLTPREAQNFWPVYNEYQAKKNEIIQERRKLSAYFIQNQSILSDREMEEITDRFVSQQQKEAELLSAYHAKFKEILPIRKVMKVYHTEAQFMTYLLKQLRDRQENMKKRMPMR